MNDYSNADKEEIQELHQRIANNIKRIRKSKGISQLDIALTIGMGSVTFFTNAENGRNNKHFNIEHLYKIAKFLNVNMCELMQ